MKANSIDEIIDELDYHLLWYRWFSKYPPNKEIVMFNKMNKSKQIEFLINKEKLNENK